MITTVTNLGCFEGFLGGYYAWISKILSFPTSFIVKTIILYHSHGAGWVTCQSLICLGVCSKQCFLLTPLSKGIDSECWCLFDKRADNSTVAHCCPKWQDSEWQATWRSGQRHRYVLMNIMGRKMGNNIGSMEKHVFTYIFAKLHYTYT